MEKSRNNTSLMTLEEVTESTSGREISGKDPALFSFTSVQTDSRNVAEGTLFVPLVGEFQNGHKYCPEAAEKGASVIFVNASEYESNALFYKALSDKYEKLFIIVVKNTLTALQDAAAGYVAKFPKLIKVCITGSSGKTTTKEMVVSVLKEKYNVVYTQGNFNSETGLPLSVFNIRKEHEAGVFEMGMNRRDEIKEISAVLKAKYAVITNIGTAHIGILGNRENIAAEKKHSFDWLGKDGCAFIPDGDDFKDFLSKDVEGKKVYYGSYVPKDVSGVSFVGDKGVSGTVFELDGEEIFLKIPGFYNYNNALSAVALGKELGLTAKQIKAGLEKLSSVSGRMEAVNLALKNGKRISLIKDCYNANPDSMKCALDFVKTVSNVTQKIYVLGDMLELGEESKIAHEKVGVLVSQIKPDFVIFVGEEMEAAWEKAVSLGYDRGLHIREKDDEAIYKVSKFILDKIQEHALLLLKASRGISLERIVPLIGEGGF